VFVALYCGQIWIFTK